MLGSKGNVRIFRIIWIILAIIITGYLYTLYKPYLSIPEQLRHFDAVSHAKFKPSGTVGQGLGFFGALLMILSVVPYMFRKRVEALECLGPLSLWLEIHIFFGILGPIFILFHSALKFNGLIGVGFWLMIIVVISGIFGRFFFGQIFRNIAQEYDLLHKMDNLLERDLQEASVRSPVIRGALEVKSSNFPSNAGLVSAIKEWAFIGRERNKIMAMIDEKYRNKGSEDYHALKKWSTEVISRLREMHEVSALNLKLSTLNKWVIIHEVSSYILFIFLVIHTFVTVYWGYRWIF
ncbi:MAG: hypothetical protein ACMUIA_06070 [bacterium]